MQLFHYDGPYSRVMGRVFDLMVLHILWLVCSLPVITIGASTTALYTVTLKMIRNEDSYAARSFWKAFRENLRTGTILWLLATGVSGVLLFCIHICRTFGGGLLLATELANVMMLLILAGSLLYLFPIAAYYENTWQNHLKNSVICSLKYLPYTLGLAAIPLAWYLIAGISRSFFAAVLAVLLLCGSSLTAWLSSFLLRKVFDRVQT